MTQASVWKKVSFNDKEQLVPWVFLWRIDDATHGKRKVEVCVASFSSRFFQLKAAALYDYRFVSSY